ncbi:TRAP transporter small permease [Celeribacter naphthalenivorans]|uniref:TRAP transporter small permease n=1 Tax=Celeribacter naphthalenivorans TaxID=1614694 RepID=UPI001CFA2DE9|nr:TRAP transporter small permease [Celeribacter naphthalenivorans]
MAFVTRVLNMAAWALMLVCMICLVSMMVHVTAHVSWRFVTGEPITGTPEIVSRYYMVAIVFLTIPLVEMRNSGIVVDLFYDLFGRSFQRLCAALAYIGQGLFFGFLTYRSFWDAIDSFAKREFVDAQIPITVWPASFFLPLGFGLAVLISTLRLVQVATRPDWHRLISPEITDEENPTPQEAA